MAEKNILMQKKNADGTFDVYYPKTKVENLIGGASGILNAIKTVDGAGSGLDADLLDGKQASAFMNNTKAYGYVSYTDSIAAGATLTKNIALGGNYKHGKAVVMSQGTFGSGLMAFFGTDNLKTMAVGNANGSATSNYGSAWSRRAVGRVSSKYDTNTAYTYGTNVLGTGKLGIDELYISGTNLVIVFRNYDTAALNLNCGIDWEVW